MELTLDQKLKFEFANLDITGANIERFYSYKLQEFLLYISELSPLQRIEATLMRMSNPLSKKSLKDFKQRYKPKKETDKQKRDYLQLNDNSEITIQKVLSERTFIQDQLARHERNLNEILHPDNREKLNIWVDYLKMKQKAIIEIQPIVPPWDQPLIALYFIYKGDILLTEKNRAEYAKQLQTEITPEAPRLYGEYQKTINRTFTDQSGKFDKEDTRKANEMLKRLRNLKIIFESRGESVPDKLISDIETLKKNLNH